MNTTTAILVAGLLVAVAVVVAALMLSDAQGDRARADDDRARRVCLAERTDGRRLPTWRDHVACD